MIMVATRRKRRKHVAIDQRMRTSTCSDIPAPCALSWQLAMAFSAISALSIE